MKLTNAEEIECAKAVLVFYKFCNDRKGSCSWCFLNNFNFCPYGDQMSGSAEIELAFKETEEPEPKKPYDVCHGNTECSNCTMELCPCR